MQIRTLQLRNYRNYERAVIRFAPGMNILTGLNAQGKTNLLESLVYLSLTRSHRLNDDQQLIRSGCEAARISCAYEDGIERKIEAVIHKGGKTLLVNGQPVHRSSEFIGLLNVVLFAPDDLGLFTDAPRERRRLMNQEIAKISPAYLKAVSRYQNLLREPPLVVLQGILPAWEVVRRLLAVVQRFLKACFSECLLISGSCCCRFHAIHG